MAPTPRPAVPDQMQALNREDLPTPVVHSVYETESVYFYTQPTRHSLGRGVWMVMLLGIIFSVASLGAATDTWLGVLETDAAQTWRHMSFGLTMGLAAIFVLFSIVLLAWPLLSHRALRTTHVIVTDKRVLQIRQRSEGRHRVRAWAISSCPDAYVTRIRGETASLVLQERVRERATDGQTIYEWEAIHGIPRAHEALLTIQKLRRQSVND